MRTLTVLLTAACLYAAAAPPAGSAEPAPPTDTSWASFRNGHEQRGVAGSPLPDKLELLWEYPTEFGVAGTAAIVGDSVYVPTVDGYLLCLNKKDGKPVWRYRSIESDDEDDFAPGFKASPLVTDKLVFVGDEDGVFHAVKRTDGRSAWKFHTQAEIAGGANISGDKVIFGSHDSFLYCLNVSDGTVVWKFQTEDRVNCAPAISGRHTFISGCDEHLRAINIDTGKQEKDIPLGSFLIASPAVVGDLLYVGTYASEVVALDWKKETFPWRFHESNADFPYHSSAAVTDKYVLVGGRDRQMHCLDRSTGEEKWSFRCKAAIDSSPAVVDGRVFFGASDGNLYELDVASGKELWRFTAGRDIVAGPAVGENVLVVGSDGARGKIFCFGKKE